VNIKGILGMKIKVYKGTPALLYKTYIVGIKVIGSPRFVDYTPILRRNQLRLYVYEY
jgi:hypothetical protein